MDDALALPAQAGNIVDEWASVKAPPAPALKPVTVDPKTTALLMLDFMNQNCGNRPRCVATIPAMKKLLTEARAKGVMVICADRGQGDVRRRRRSKVAPVAGEPIVKVRAADKFLNTDLEKMLKDKGIQDRDRGRHVGERRRALYGERAAFVRDSMSSHPSTA